MLGLVYVAMSEEIKEVNDPLADKVAADMSDGRGERGRPRRRKKVSFLTLNKVDSIDYRDITTLERFLTNDRGKILPSRQTGNTAKQQRMVAHAVKKAREMALIPFVKRDAVDTGPRQRAPRERGEGKES